LAAEGRASTESEQGRQHRALQAIESALSLARSKTNGAYRMRNIEVSA
jgi:hypothetical protein